MHSNIGVFHLFSKKPNCPWWSFFSPTWRSKQLSAFCLYRLVCSRHVTWVNHTYCMVFLRCFHSLRITSWSAYVLALCIDTCWSYIDYLWWPNNTLVCGHALLCLFICKWILGLFALIWRLIWLCLYHYLRSRGIFLAGTTGNEMTGTHAEKLESDEPCALMELHQQQPGNSTHLLYKHKRGQRVYLIPAGSLYREQSQAAVVWEEEAVVDTACTHCHHIYLGQERLCRFHGFEHAFFF